MKYLIYTRVSPKGSTFEGETSVGMQEQVCRDFIEKHRGGEVAGVICDDLISGKDTNRPGIRELFAQLDNGTAEWDALCIYRLDRLTRSMMDQLMIFRKFVEANRGIVSATEPNFDYSTPIGRLQLSQIAAINQYYREVNAENTRNKMMSIAAKGECPNGVPPIGYKRGERKDNVLYVDPRPAAMVQEIFRMYLSPNFTTIDICRQFKIHHQQILNILRNKTYTGVICYGGKEFPGKHQAIISADTYAAVMSKLPQAKLRTRPKQHKYPYLLGGLIRCTCGRNLTPASAKSCQYHYYRCTDSVKCKHKVSAPDLEQRVIDRLINVKFDDDSRQRLYAEVEQRRHAYLQERLPNMINLEAAIREAEAERDRIYQVLLSVSHNNNATFLSLKLDELTGEIDRHKNELAVYNAVKNCDRALYEEMDRIVDQLNALSALLVKHPENRDLQRQAIIANVDRLQELPDGSFKIYYNYGTPSCISWLPRQESNLD